MNEACALAIRERFRQFVSDLGSDLEFMLRIKVEHSYRVAAECRGLASSLGWPAAHVRAAEILGLLHDVGRFAQLRKSGSLVDSPAMDHGEMGWVAVRQWGWLEDCPAPRRDAILKGIRHHNKRHLPTDLAPEALALLKLVRDADKLDIYAVVAEVLQHDHIEKHPEIFVHLDLQGPATPALLAEVNQRQPGSYRHMQTLTDFKIVLASWAYDLNYVETARRIRERNIFPALAQALPDDPDVQACVTAARRHLEGA